MNPKVDATGRNRTGDLPLTWHYPAYRLVGLTEVRSLAIDLGSTPVKDGKQYCLVYP